MAAERQRWLVLCSSLNLACAVICAPPLICVAAAADAPDNNVATSSAADVSALPVSAQSAAGGLLPSVNTLAGNASAIGLSTDLTQFGVPGLDSNSTSSAYKPAWTLTGALQLGAEYEMGTNNGSSDASQFVATIAPSINATVNTQRFNGYVFYNPIVLLATGSGSGSNNDGSRVAQSFNGQLSAALIPQALGVDLTGFATETSRFGGFRQQAVSPVLSEAALQTYSFAIRPYAEHAFGTVATARLDFQLADTFQNSQDLSGGLTGLTPGQAQALNEIANTDLLTKSLKGSVRTGDDFGRYRGTIMGQATEFDGSGVLAHAHRDDVSVENDYALTRKITLLSAVGYEDVKYAGTSPVLIRDVLWNVGVRYQPTEKSSVSLRYGRRDGFDSLTAIGNLMLTERLSLFARYSAALSTDLEDIENTVNDDGFGAIGTIDASSTPRPTESPNGFAGAQSGLYRLKRLSAGGRLYYDRDNFAVSFERETRKLISSASALVADLGFNSSNNTTSGAVTWTHLFSPTWTGVAVVSYGVIDGQPAFLGSVDRNNFLTATVQATDELTPTLWVSVSYSYTNSGTPGILARIPATAQNSFLVSLRKTF